MDNYTRLLQSEQRTLNRTLTESQQRALGLLQCQRLQLQRAAQAECTTIRDEVTSARLTISYQQVAHGIHTLRSQVNESVSYWLFCWLVASVL